MLHSINPSEEHYEAAKQLLLYLSDTKTHGIYFWRSNPHPDLPTATFPTTKPDTYKSDDTTVFPDTSGILVGAVDSDWGSDTTHRRSVSGIALMVAGGPVLYQSKFQRTIALSSTEAEFAAACEAGKCILFVRSILDEIGMPQDSATPLYIDNNGALLMANAKKPTNRTRHVDVKEFVLLDWVEQDLITMRRITTSANYSDGLTKPLARILHYRHFDRLMGRYTPSYVKIPYSI
jgi:hypothetical protein